MKQLVSVIVPVWNHEGNQKSEFPSKALSLSLDMLRHFDIIWVTGQNNALPEWTNQYQGTVTYRFEDPYFSGPDTFTRLLLSSKFYDRFDWCEFVFILDYQTIILKNELFYWCKQGYDYIQPARLQTHSLLKSYFKSSSVTVPDTDYQGFTSLRRVDRSLKASQKYAGKALSYCNVKENRPLSDWNFWEMNTHPWKSDIRIPTPVNRNRFGRFSKEVSPQDIEKKNIFVVTDVTDHQTAAWNLIAE